MLKLQEIEIPKDDPFKNDLLARKRGTDILTNLLKDISHPFVLAIDGKWGVGKTKFVEMWQKQLELNGYPTIFFNAWENDFWEDPFTPIIGEIINKFRGSEIERETTGELITKLKKSAKVIFRGLSTNLLTNFINEQSIEELEKIISEKTFDNRLEAYLDVKNEMNDFKTLLAQLAQNAAPFDESNDNDITEENKLISKPLFFFVDEIDRCQPMFGIKLLERIKHLFEIEGIIFVVSIDKKQFMSSIKSVYGNDFDAENYLKRFFDIILPLKTRYTEGYFNYIANSSSGNRELRSTLIETVDELSNVYDINLRDIEKIHTIIETSLKTKSYALEKNATFYFTLAVIKVMDALFFDKIMEDFIEGKEILERFIQLSNGKFDSQYIIASLLYFSPSLSTEEKVNKARDLDNNYNHEFYIRTLSGTYTTELYIRHLENIKRGLSIFT